MTADPNAFRDQYVCATCGQPCGMYGHGCAPTTVHELKCWPQYFAEVVGGSKTFEVRKDDRGYQQGDLLILREYDPATDTYSGQTVRAEIGYVLRDSCAAIPNFDGHVVFSLLDVTGGSTPNPTEATAPNAPSGETP